MLPHKRPTGGAMSVATTAPTPAMVVMAATGIVTTLSGAAHPFIDPACQTAIGVLTVHATSAAMTASATEDRNSEAPSLLAIQGHGNNRHQRDKRSSQRR